MVYLIRLISILGLFFISCTEHLQASQEGLYTSFVSGVDDADDETIEIFGNDESRLVTIKKKLLKYSDLLKAEMLDKKVDKLYVDKLQASDTVMHFLPNILQIFEEYDQEMKPVEKNLAETKKQIDENKKQLEKISKSENEQDKKKKVEIENTIKTLEKEIKSAGEKSKLAMEEKLRKVLENIKIQDFANAHAYLGFPNYMTEFIRSELVKDFANLRSDLPEGLTKEFQAFLTRDLSRKFREYDERLNPEYKKLVRARIKDRILREVMFMDLGWIFYQIVSDKPFNTFDVPIPDVIWKSHLTLYSNCVPYTDKNTLHIINIPSLDPQIKKEPIHFAAEKGSLKFQVSNHCNKIVINNAMKDNFAVWDDSGKKLSEDINGQFDSLVWAPYDTKFIAELRKTKELNIYDGKANKLLALPWKEDSKPVWSPDGSRIILVDRIYDVMDDTKLTKLASVKPASNRSWSADGKKIAGVNTENVLTIWDSVTGNVLKSSKFEINRKITAYKVNGKIIWSPEDLFVLNIDEGILFFVPQLFDKKYLKNHQGKQFKDLVWARWLNPELLVMAEQLKDGYKFYYYHWYGKQMIEIYQKIDSLKKEIQHILDNGTISQMWLLFKIGLTLKLNHPFVFSHDEYKIFSEFPPLVRFALDPMGKYAKGSPIKGTAISSSAPYHKPASAMDPALPQPPTAASKTSRPLPPTPTRSTIPIALTVTGHGPKKLPPLPPTPAQAAKKGEWTPTHEEIKNKLLNPENITQPILVEMIEAIRKAQSSAGGFDAKANDDAGTTLKVHAEMTDNSYMKTKGQKLSVKFAQQWKQLMDLLK